MVAAGIANLQKGDNQHKKEGGSIEPSTYDAAKQMNVGRGTVERARAVKDKGTPGLADIVRDGKASARIIGLATGNGCYVVTFERSTGSASARESIETMLTKLESGCH